MQANHNIHANLNTPRKGNPVRVMGGMSGNPFTRIHFDKRAKPQYCWPPPSNPRPKVTRKASTYRAPDPPSRKTLARKVAAAARARKRSMRANRSSEKGAKQNSAEIQQEPTEKKGIFGIFDLFTNFMPWSLLSDGSPSSSNSSSYSGSFSNAPGAYPSSFVSPPASTPSTSSDDSDALPPSSPPSSPASVSTATLSDSVMEPMVLDTTASLLEASLEKEDEIAQYHVEDMQRTFDFQKMLDEQREKVKKASKWAASKEFQEEQRRQAEYSRRVHQAPEHIKEVLRRQRDAELDKALAAQTADCMNMGEKRKCKGAGDHIRPGDKERVEREKEVMREKEEALQREMEERKRRREEARRKNAAHRQGQAPGANDIRKNLQPEADRRPGAATDNGHATGMSTDDKARQQAVADAEERMRARAKQREDAFFERAKKAQEARQRFARAQAAQEEQRRAREAREAAERERADRWARGDDLKSYCRRLREDIKGIREGKRLPEQLAGGYKLEDRPRGFGRQPSIKTAKQVEADTRYERRYERIKYGAARSRHQFRPSFQPYPNYKANRSRSRLFFNPDEPINWPKPIFVQEDPLQAHFSRYERLWGMLSNPTPSADITLTFATMPWPLLATPTSLEDFTLAATSAFLFHAQRPSQDGEGGKTRRARLREELLRWHPDKFEHRVLGRVVPADRELVRAGADAVIKVLTDLKGVE